MKATISNIISLETSMGLWRKLNFKHQWVFVWEKKKDARTLSQNGLYQWWVDIIAKEVGNFHDEQSQELMKHFIPPTHQKKAVDGTMKDAWSSKKLDIKQMSNLMDMVLIWANGEGYRLPLPEDQHYRG